MLVSAENGVWMTHLFRRSQRYPPGFRYPCRLEHVALHASLKPAGFYPQQTTPIVVQSGTLPAARTASNSTPSSPTNWLRTLFSQPQSALASRRPHCVGPVPVIPPPHSSTVGWLISTPRVSLRRHSWLGHPPW